MRKKNKIVIFDVDGVLSSGHFLYSIEGKIIKFFGPHDNDGLKILGKYINFFFVTADIRGFKITKKRVVNDMKCDLKYVEEGKRVQFLEKFKKYDVIYMGDGHHDLKVFDKVAYSIAPLNALKKVRDKAHYVTKYKASEGAVYDACEHIITKILKKKF